MAIHNRFNRYGRHFEQMGRAAGRPMGWRYSAQARPVRSYLISALAQGYGTAGGLFW